jgi:alpha-beta hydrolase superfamily lysophospholipase
VTVNTYNDFFPSLAARGIEVYTFDQRYVCHSQRDNAPDTLQRMGQVGHEELTARQLRNHHASPR